MSAAAALAPGRVVLVPARCAVRFRARVLGVPVPGGLALRTGEVTIDDTGADVTAVLDATSFRTRSPRRDRDVRSARFLDVDRHADIVFAGRWEGPGTTLSGHLTVRGVTAALDLEIAAVDTLPDGVMVRARGRVDRRAYPVGPGAGPIGRRVEVDVDLALRRG